mmetsp:Transcript_4216/g.11886  ORF Transcript_4216/g.11886 Transcript_4216/m.11886 type:complete len:223 (+) Transcript_4216:1083-1751(+)
MSGLKGLRDARGGAPWRPAAAASSPPTLSRVTLPVAVLLDHEPLGHRLTRDSPASSSAGYILRFRLARLRGLPSAVGFLSAGGTMLKLPCPLASGTNSETCDLSFTRRLLEAFDHSEGGSGAFKTATLRAVPLGVGAEFCSCASGSRCPEPIGKDLLPLCSVSPPPPGARNSQPVTLRVELPPLPALKAFNRGPAACRQATFLTLALAAPSSFLAREGWTGP